MEPGAQVLVVGLQGDRFAHLNGSTVTVVRRVPGVDRYEVSFGQGVIKSIRADNLRVANMAQSRRCKIGQMWHITAIGSEYCHAHRRMLEGTASDGTVTHRRCESCLGSGSLRASERVLACGACAGMGVRLLTTVAVHATIGVGTSPMAFTQTTSAAPSPIGAELREGPHNRVLACCPRCKCEFHIIDAAPLQSLDQAALHQAAKEQYTLL